MKGYAWITIAVFVAISVLFIPKILLCSADVDSTLRVSEVVRIYDGDTVYVNIDGLPKVFGQNIGVRLYGIDTPELRGSDECVKRMARISKLELSTFVRKGKIIEIQNPSRDKYFRLNGDLLIDGQSASQHMLNKGLAHVYTGGARERWICDQSWFEDTINK
jgi:micrococcal nuclease